MAVGQHILDLSVRSLRACDALMEYCQRSDEVWHSLHVTVAQGHPSRVLDPTTGVEVTAQGLATMATKYRAAYLLPLAVQQLTSLFESFFFDFLKAILVNNPLQLAQRKQIEVGLALSAPDRAALIELIAERELNEIKYRKPREWFEFLEKLVRLGCPTADEMDSLAEMKACRDVLAHNAGIVNTVYMDKAGVKTRWALNNLIMIDPFHFHEYWTLTRKIIHDLSSAATARFTTP